MFGRAILQFFFAQTETITVKHRYMTRQRICGNIKIHIATQNRKKSWFIQM